MLSIFLTDYMKMLPKIILFLIAVTITISITFGVSQFSNSDISSTRNTITTTATAATIPKSDFNTIFKLKYTNKRRQ